MIVPIISYLIFKIVSRLNSYYFAYNVIAQLALTFIQFLICQIQHLQNKGKREDKCILKRSEATYYSLRKNTNVRVFETNVRSFVFAKIGTDLVTKTVPILQKRTFVRFCKIGTVFVTNKISDSSFQSFLFFLNIRKYFNNKKIFGRKLFSSAEDFFYSVIFTKIPIFFEQGFV